MENEIQYTFIDRKQSVGPNGRLVVCPRCGERLERVDLEAYMRCPYCSYQFVMNEQMETFLLRPAMMDWFKENFLKFPQ